MTSCFGLNREQRFRLLGGDYTPLLCDTKPHGCEPGATYVLSWSRVSRTLAGDVVVDIPKQPIRYLTVTSVKRHRKGGWLIRFDVEDKREPVRYLRRTPPVWDPHNLEGPVESSYTSSKWAALDELEVVPDQWQEQNAKDAYRHDHALRLERVATRQQEKWRRKRQSRNVANALRAVA